MNLVLAALSIPAGFVFANGAEWFLHKYQLHGRGTKKGGFWSFHWREHHRNARRNAHHDPDYELPLLRGWNGQTKEAAGLLLGAVVMAPSALVSPVFYATVLFCALEYYVKHKRAHLDAAWAREHLPWHYDHHMGPNQDANWCVTRPWFDLLLGTRIPYVGTEREAADIARDAERKARKEARAVATEEPSAAQEPAAATA